MRPLRLELSGFTCFRDFTVIDFSNLELFAIVGQTGAGKSSILDAITFALFEQTPRLGSKPAKELIAQGSTGMSLSLEFEASDGRKYRVARIFSSKSSEVRFERLEDGKWATAVEQTKKKEVAEAIERTVGLDFDAFTKAVLLPQGEFDRFLRGEPKQRRDLLKNLIGLERIETMQKHSNEIAKEAKTKSEALQIQLESLQHATPDALSNLELEQEKQTTQLTQTETTLEKTRTDLLEAREIRRLELALESVKLELQNLELQQPQIEITRQRSVQARRVASVLPLLKNTKKLEVRLVEIRQEVTRAELAHQAALEFLNKQQLLLETARDNALARPELEAKITHLTTLMPRLERLRQLGGKLEKNASETLFSEEAWSELERFKTELPLLERSSKQLRELERRRAELLEVAMRLEEAQSALSTEEQALSISQQQLTIASGHLEETREVAIQIPSLDFELQQLEVLKPKLQRLKELGGNLQDADSNATVFSEAAWSGLEKISNELKTHAKLKKQLSDLQTNLETSHKDLQFWTSQLEESQAVLTRVMADGKAAAANQKKLETTLEATKRENIAAELVRGLALGDPCPVCGEPLKHLPDLTGSLVPQAEQALQEEIIRVGQLRDEYTQLKEARKNQEDNKTRANQELQRHSKTLQEIQLEIQQLEQSWNIDLVDPKSALQNARAALLAGLAAELTQAGASNFEAKRKTLQQQKIVLEQAERQAAQQLNDTQTLVARHESTLKAAQALLISRQIEQKNALQESIRLEQQRLELEMERKAFLSKLETRLGTQKPPAQALAEAQKAMLDGFATQLLEAGASQNLKTEIETLKTQAQQLEQKEHEAREAYSNAKTQLAGLTSALEATQKNLKEAEQETQAAAAESTAKLLALGLTNPQEALEMSLSEHQIQALEQSIQHHTQQYIQTQSRQNDHVQELNGRKLEIPLETLEEKAILLEQQSQVIRNTLGRLEAEKIQLNKQITQAKNLRREQNSLEKRFDTYAALAQDMKGNEFQDYLLIGVQQQLLRRATKTMQDITRERYTLELIESEFHVRDAWNGTESRGVKTLSGGESFIASLSLALSLSDYLAGSQALGALFLDEGFGTLDADALEMVANTLENLQTQGRMVGVITHVPALAERLPTRLHIEKAQDTSRVRWE
jgi:DNA repair protein SbcC/Rad50